ncbi:hypothetical protein DIPPA_22088 [Diplonema papillatum]|nr:hypothetical protein DIPPA_22088 [Diplonema papillatum]
MSLEAALQAAVGVIGFVAGLAAEARFDRIRRAHGGAARSRLRWRAACEGTPAATAGPASGPARRRTGTLYCARRMCRHARRAALALGGDARPRRAFLSKRMSLEAALQAAVGVVGFVAGLAAEARFERIRRAHGGGAARSRLRWRSRRRRAACEGTPAATAGPGFGSRTRVRSVQLRVPHVADQYPYCARRACRHARRAALAQ